MDANANAGAQHPHFVHIPDPRQTEGVRAYREPDEPHPLQLTFLDAAAERAWIAGIADLLAAGRGDEADAHLSADLAGFDGRLARLCKGVPRDSVALKGWDDLLPILGEWEGPPITAITVGLTNPPDLVFDGGAGPEPELLIGLYSDESFPFGGSTNADVLAECGKEMPGWAGGEEDVEFYCTLSGLAELNGALINWKHRHYLRDGRDGVEGRAPGGYVEYVVASWFLATRFLQAVERAILEHGVPGGCRVIAGTVDVNADFVTVIGKERPARAITSPPAEPSFATLTVKPWVPREDPAAAIIEPPASLRQRIMAAPLEPEPQPQSGLLARLFGRLRRR